MSALQQEDAIWQRTRARHPMNDMTLDELSAMLTMEDEPELPLMEEEEFHYQEFLQVGLLPAAKRSQESSAAAQLGHAAACSELLMNVVSRLCSKACASHHCHAKA